MSKTPRMDEVFRLVEDGGADMRVRVDVSPEDIAQGVQGDPENDPLARAMTRALRSYLRAPVSVATTHKSYLVYDARGNLVAERPWPPSLSNFAKQFDQHRGSVKPVRFMLPVKGLRVSPAKFRTGP